MRDCAGFANMTTKYRPRVNKKPTTNQEPAVRKGTILATMRNVANRHQCRRHYAQLMTSCELVEAYSAYRAPKHAERVVLPKDVNVGESKASASSLRWQEVGWRKGAEEAVAMWAYSVALVWLV